MCPKISLQTLRQQLNLRIKVTDMAMNSIYRSSTVRGCINKPNRRSIVARHFSFTNIIRKSRLFILIEILVVKHGITRETLISCKTYISQYIFIDINRKFEKYVLKVYSQTYTNLRSWAIILLESTQWEDGEFRVDTH